MTNHIIFQYDGVEGLWSRYTKPWSSVEITLQSKDKGFNMEIFEGHQTTHHKSHHLSLQHVQDLYNGYTYNIHYILDFLYYYISYDGSVSNKHFDSIKVNPIGQNFVRICYHGPERTAVFTVTIKESGNVLILLHGDV